MEAITREEQFMAAAAGQAVELPEPITRREKFLKAIADAVQSGGASAEVIQAAVNKYLEENPVEAVGGVQTVNGVAPDENGNVEVAAGGESYIAGLKTIASGTIPTGTAAGVTDTGLTVGDLRKYKYFVARFKSTGQNTYWGLSWRSAWGCLGKCQHSTIAFTYEWYDSNKTVLQIFVGSGTGNEGAVGINDNSSLVSPLLSKYPNLLIMGDDATPIYVQYSDALTVDATWEIKGCLEYES